MFNFNVPKGIQLGNEFSKLTGYGQIDTSGKEIKTSGRRLQGDSQLSLILRVNPETVQEEMDTINMDHSFRWSVEAFNKAENKISI